MNNLNQLIIIGGGVSIKEGIDKGLWDKLKDRFSIGLNSNYKDFNSTFLLFSDDDFYVDNHEDLGKLPLVIGKDLPRIHPVLKPNTILLDCVPNIYHGRESINQKWYCCNGGLAGVIALSLGIYLLDKGTIFLLGYDYGASKKEVRGKPCTHYYQEDESREHRGYGKVDYYTTYGNVERDFKPFEQEKRIQIFNVSPQSKIEAFPRINYDSFFQKLDDKIYDQDELREDIKRRME